MTADGEVQLQYWLFRLHHFNPSDVMRMNPNEKKILYAFMRYELEARQKENERLGGE